MSNKDRLTTITEQIIELTNKERVRWVDVGNETYTSTYADVNLTFHAQTRTLTFTDAGGVEDKFDLSTNKLGYNLAKAIVDFIQRRTDMKANVLDSLFQIAKPATESKREALDVYGKQIAEEMMSLFDDIIDATNPNLPKQDTGKEPSFLLGDLYAFLKKESKFEIQALVNAGVAFIVVPDDVIKKHKQTFDAVQITINETIDFMVDNKEGQFNGVRYENKRPIPGSSFRSENLSGILDHINQQVA